MIEPTNDWVSKGESGQVLISDGKGNLGWGWNWSEELEEKKTDDEEEKENP